VDYRAILKPLGRDTFLAIKVVPRSSKNQLMGIENGELKIKIKAPPVDGEANDEALDFISEVLGFTKRNLSVQRGKASRHKIIKIRDVGVHQVLEALSNSLKTD
jgi:uncharacterized protein (TIGR00251 family)